MIHNHEVPGSIPGPATRERGCKKLQPLFFLPHLSIFYSFYSLFDNFIISFEINLEDNFARREKYSSKLDISRSLMRIFETNLEDTFARCEKYSSKLDISRSLIVIFG